MVRVYYNSSNVPSPKNLPSKYSDLVGKILWFGKDTSIMLFAKYKTMYGWKASHSDFYCLVLEHHLTNSGRESLYVWLPTPPPLFELDKCWIIVGAVEAEAMTVVA